MTNFELTEEEKGRTEEELYKVTTEHVGKCLNHLHETFELLKVINRTHHGFHHLNIAGMKIEEAEMWLKNFNEKR